VILEVKKKEIENLETASTCLENIFLGFSLKIDYDLI
jgi:hypothetical protein